MTEWKYNTNHKAEDRKEGRSWNETQIADLFSLAHSAQEQGILATRIACSKEIHQDHLHQLTHPLEGENESKKEHGRYFIHGIGEEEGCHGARGASTTTVWHAVVREKANDFFNHVQESAREGGEAWIEFLRRASASARC